MSRYINTAYKQKSESFFAKAAEIKEEKENIIDLSLGDPDLITAENIIKKAAEDAKSGHTRYAHPRGEKKLRTDIKKYYKNNYNADIKKEEIMLTVGACHGTFLALTAVLNPEEEVIIPSPYFTPYKDQVKLAGGKAVFVESKFKDDFKIDLNKLEKKINKNTKAILINSPHNPTGAVQNKEVLDKLIEIAEKYDLLILSDEVYENFDFKNKFHSLIDYKNNFERIIILNSFSKTFAMTGWRLGFVIADSNILDVMQNINEGICYSAPTISQRAAIEALKNEKKIKDEIRQKFSKRMEYSYQRLKNNELFELADTAGTFYLFPKIKNNSLKAEIFALRLLKEEGVLVLPGDDFGVKNGEFIRIACTLGLEKLEKAFDKIDNFSDKYI